MYNDELFSRTRALLGGDAMQKLRDAHVCVFGVGGVGGYVAEMLARCGVGCITLFDSDRVSLTNRNRQIIALDSTTGMLKTSAMAERLRDINPQIQVASLRSFVDAAAVFRDIFCQIGRCCAAGGQDACRQCEQDTGDLFHGVPPCNLRFYSH